MSQREPFWDRVVAARRVLGPFVGLRRVHAASSTPEIGRLGGQALARADAIGRACVREAQRGRAPCACGSVARGCPLPGTGPACEWQRGRVYWRELLGRGALAAQDELEGIADGE